MNELIQIQIDTEGTLISRPNRFLAYVKLNNGSEVAAHVHDPGRLEEILYAGNRVLLKRVNNRNRKTQWDMIAGDVENKWILIHSGYHRAIAQTIIEQYKPFGNFRSIQAEVTFGHSRIDFVLEQERQLWVEVKGCTLARNKIALFPDAPTKRGTKHLQTLIDIKKSGMNAAILILIFRPDAECFSPNKETDPKFAETFHDAITAGVNIVPIVLSYDGKFVRFLKYVALCED